MIARRWVALKRIVLRIIGLLSIFLICAFISKGQSFQYGKYQLFSDLDSNQVFQVLLEINSDSTYEFTYEGNYMTLNQKGSWIIDSNVFSLKIDTVYDPKPTVGYCFILHDTLQESVVKLLDEGRNGIPNLETECYVNGSFKPFKTDSIGQFVYDLDALDSVCFSVKGYQLSVEAFSIRLPREIIIIVDSSPKKSVYEQLGIYQITIENDKLKMEYLDLVTNKNQTEYLKKIE